MCWFCGNSKRQRDEMDAKEVYIRKVEVEAKVNAYAADIWAKCKKELAEYEHDYHSTKEIRGIELARLQAEIDAKRDYLADKDKQIAYLRSVIDILSKKGA